MEMAESGQEKDKEMNASKQQKKEDKMRRISGICIMAGFIVIAILIAVSRAVDRDELAASLPASELIEKTKPEKPAPKPVWPQGVYDVESYMAGITHAILVLENHWNIKKQHQNIFVRELSGPLYEAMVKDGGKLIVKSQGCRLLSRTKIVELVAASGARKEKK